MSRPPCRFFNKPGGCHRGNQCTFAHTTPPSRRSSDAVNSSASSSQVNTPPGACRLYWTSGTCRHEFKCRFNHVSPDSPPVAPPSRRFTLPDDSVADQVAPFLTKDGLVKLLGSGGTDSYFANPAKPLSPNQAHTAIKRFLYDDFRFRKNTDVYAFMLPINSASSHNDLWSLEDGQLFFAALASGNGLLRIDDVLRYEPVAIAPSGTETLSFHRGFLPLLRFLSSDFVTKSTLNHLINALYSGVLANIGKIHETIVKCFTEALEAGSFNDPGHRTAPVPVGHQVIATLTAILFECLTRFKNATVNFPNLAVLVRDLQRFSADWIARVTSTPPTVKDTLCDPEVSVSTRRHVIAQFHSKLDRLVAIVDGEEGRIKPARQMTNSAFRADSNEGLLAALHESFEGPGTLRSAGPRHDNDFIDIRDIRIAPTDEELKSKFPPYLPANIYGAPHPHPESSMQRLLDIQFRLLREELTAPIRLAVQLVSDDLQQGPRAVTPLSQLLRKGGGKYRSTGPEGILPSPLPPPPGRARADNAQTRAAFWEGMSGKRMMQGGLVALVWKRGAHIQTHLGLLSSSSKDIASSAKQSPDTVSARVVFFDPEVELHILDTFKHRSYDPDEVKLFVEATVMYEAIRPFLEALCVVPETLPFSRYLPHFPPDSFKTVKIEPPKYATAPGFRFQLASLFDPDADVDDFVMNASSPASTNAARLALRRSRLDPSQAESVVDSLTREVSLIQGPPGTGKSFTGVELLRVLLDNNVGPILLIAFTNHALDHMLCSVLDAGFTSKIVRLGSRSADERISQYSLETKEFAATTSRLTKAFDTQRRELRSVEDKVKELTKKIVKTTISQDDLIEYLMVYHPGHFEILHHPPHWVQLVKTFQDHQTNGWQQVGKNGRTMAEAEDSSWYAFWRSSRDLEFLQADPLSALTKSQPQPSHDASNVASITNSFSALDVSPGEDVSDDEDESPSSSSLVSPEELWMYLMDDNDEASSPPETDASHSAPAPAPVIHRAGSPTSSFHVTDLYDPVLFFDTLGTAQPDIPMTDRPLIALLDEDDVWCMSTIERQRISAFWEEELRRISHEIYISDFKSLRKEHATLLSEYSEGQTEVRRQLLQSVDIVGCTTTGAAKLTSLLKSLEPRVMMVEEAGQVLEAHILGTLVPSIEHLILIGDPLQLRPTLNNYSLSMDSRRGSRLFRFDMSLMERLARAGLPMSRINEQRRMRPAISNLIRRTLYPTLEDHPLVLDHPPVRGLSKSIYFLNHNHRENSQGDESASKYNTYEVAMIRDFVLYLLRQGCYSHDGDIVVLCAYLGQLARVRDALSKDVTVAIDERDQEKLDATEEEKSADGILDPPTDIEVIGVTKVVVILSLVRNSGNIGGDDDDEDWVRSSNNRTNVALSRAREGLYILGNAPLLSAKSPMWNDEVAYKLVTSASTVATFAHTNAILMTQSILLSSACNSVEDFAQKVIHVISGALKVVATVDSLSHMLSFLALIYVNMLRVCGEDCTIQICNICAPESRLSQVVDLILYRTLGDIDPDMNAVDELTITLPKCRHVFTVETLDGHTGLGDYYTSDEAGNWVSLKSPEGSNPISPPVCPTCRTAITSPRYGRVFKRADLDILERNVIADMTQSLSKLQEALDRIDKEAIIQSIKNAVKEGFSCSSSTATTEQVKDQAKQRRKILSDGDDNILPEFALNPSTSRFHNVPSEIATLWKQQTSRLNTAYRQLRSITNTRSAHMRAWEAAFSFLYQQEMELVMSDPSHAPQDPTIHAMRMARLKVGQPQPRADKRFVVEAIWVSLRVRFSLIEIGRVLNEHLSSMYPLKERQRWALFIQFLLQSCARDARNALEIARDSDSRRQIIASILFILRIDFDMFTFNVEMSKQVPAEWQHRRDDMIDKAERKVSEVEERISIALSEIPPQESMDDLRETFSSRASGILDEWKSFTTCLRDGNVYLPLSRDEQVEIVRALNFSHTGHFYNCPNGHTFVITECGGAMQRATCPECGSPIGGSDHTLDASNTRATEYEDILRNQGGQASPFAWGVKWTMASRHDDM
ncbi:hypothetical protein ONZ45_g408 [Pleurotus djamor]|nr:hypothetical protein ONZ45_g408 [Pleurotus djamor]